MNKNKGWKSMYKKGQYIVVRHEISIGEDGSEYLNRWAKEGFETVSVSFMKYDDMMVVMKYKGGK